MACFIIILIVCCGVCGGSGMLDCLRIVNRKRPSRISVTPTTQTFHPANPLPQTHPIPTPPHPQWLMRRAIEWVINTAWVLRVCSFRVGAKHFSFDFDWGRTAPYHIIEKRGRFVGSLWLGFKSLQWLITTWRSLRQTEDLKGFFRFLRTEYSNLEMSCLQNHYGRFVEICEYNGGAQRFDF